MELIRSDTNWLTNPPQVRLTVCTQDAVTPKQVQLLEEFLKQQIAQPFTLIFEVTQVEEVRRENQSPSTSKRIP